MAPPELTTPPGHLSESARTAWAELVEGGESRAELAALEAVCVQIARARDAQARIDAEGIVVEGPKGVPIPHPAIAIERAAQAEVHKWSAVWASGIRARERRRAQVDPGPQ